MSTPSLFPFDNSYARDLPGFYVDWHAEAAPAPELLRFNADLADELGLDAKKLAGPDGLAVFAGQEMPAGAHPLAQAYAGHQFGGFSPQLGDGRALLLGEVIDRAGARRDIQLKGSGRTPFSRGGDGKAAIGPVLREYLIGEAMHALGIPTTRALAAVSTGESVRRERPLPGAILTRVAASHLRVGTFQFFAAKREIGPLKQLADYAINRHFPAVREADNRYLSLFDAVVAAQAALIARWMLVGFVHGVMNTDNMTISGETIDYGPCAFIDRYDPKTVFSSIDHGGRYALGNQPAVAQWNLARFAETLLPLIDEDTENAARLATNALAGFIDTYQRTWRNGMAAKFGFSNPTDADDLLVNDFLELLMAHGADFTNAFRALSPAARGADGAFLSLLSDAEPGNAWLARWRQRQDGATDPAALAKAMDTVNPLYIPRNHLVEAALQAAETGDLQPFEKLLQVVTAPFEFQEGWEAYASPAPAEFGAYTTYCGT